MVWDIDHPGWTTRTRESEYMFLDNWEGGPARARRYTPQEELMLQLGTAIAAKLAGEETSKRMKSCVAGRAICPELAGVIANIFHNRQVQVREHHSAVGVGKDTPATRSTGIDHTTEQRRRGVRVVTAPKRLILGFGPDSSHPSEFESEREPSGAQSGVTGLGTGITRSETRSQVEALVAHQGIMLARLLKPLSDRTLPSEQRRGSLSERDQTKLPMPVAGQPQKARRTNVGSNET